MDKIGVTERGDAALDLQWLGWVRNGKPAILISKDPSKLSEVIKLHKEIWTNIIVHTTITGFGGTIVEPNVPLVQNAISGYCAICKLLGPDRVVLRIDPVVPTKTGLETAYQVLQVAQRYYKTRVRISFIDLYDHVKLRFEKNDIKLPWSSFHAPLKLRMEAWEQLGQPEICGEPDFECTGCVSARDCELLGLQPFDRSFKQRQFCACLGNKKELLDRKAQCSHGCLYCYYR